MKKLLLMVLLCGLIANTQTIPHTGTDPSGTSDFAPYDWTAPLKFPNNNTKFLRGDWTWATPASGGGVNGNLMVADLGAQGQTNIQNKSVWVLMPSEGWTQYPASNQWKLRFRFTGIPDGVKISNMVIAKANTFRNGAARPVVSTTAVTIGGVSNPVIAPSGASESFFDTDAIPVTVVSGFDYWLIVFFANDAVNSTASISHNFNNGLMMGTDYITGDQTAAAFTPATTDAAPATLTASQANLVSNVLSITAP